MAETKYRIPPCPAYDIPGMESWLEDMAARGLHLEKDGFFGLLASFTEGPPKKERFRLEATDRNGGLFSEEYDPEDEALQMLREMGWTYRARRGQFHIYSTDDPDAPELNTDPQVQAVTMAALTKYLWKRLRDGLILTFFYLLLYFGDLLISGTLLLGTPLVLLYAGVLLWDLGRRTRELVTVAGYRRQLKNGDPLPHRSDYQKHGRRYLVGKLLRPVLWTGLVLCTLGRVLPLMSEGPYEPLTDQTFPFSTIEAYYPGARVERQDSFLKSQVYRWSDPLAPENYDFSEYARVTQDGEALDIWLTVNYHRTRWDWTARMLAKEFVSQAGANRFEQAAARVFGDEPVIAAEIALPDADYCAYFFDHGSDPILVIQKNNVVIRVNLDILGGIDPEPEALARSILLQIQ